jgi:hypothetical protein
MSILPLPMPTGTIIHVGRNRPDAEENRISDPSSKCPAASRRIERPKKRKWRAFFTDQCGMLENAGLNSARRSRKPEISQRESVNRHRQFHIRPRSNFPRRRLFARGFDHAAQSDGRLARTHRWPCSQMPRVLRKSGLPTSQKAGAA